jgi:hypothetical protein
LGALGALQGACCSSGEDVQAEWPNSDGNEAFAQLADQLRYIDVHELALKSNVQVVYQAYYNLLAAGGEARKTNSNLKHPVLIIDEANVLLKACAAEGLVWQV